MASRKCQQGAELPAVTGQGAPSADKVKSFEWFHPQKEEKPMDLKTMCLCVEDLCPRSQVIPIPLVRDRYPYRYSSAGPTSFGRTRKELDLHRCRIRLQPIEHSQNGHKSHRGLDPAGVRQLEGWETTSVQDSLKMFNAPEETKPGEEFQARHIPKNLCEPTWVPFVAHSEFDRYIIDSLHPTWTRDPLYKRHPHFYMKPRNAEEEWDDEWQKLKKPKRTRKMVNL